VHCDLKPENVMLADSGAVKLLDLGIAKLLHDAATDAPARLAGDLDRPDDARDSITRPGAVMGTLEYMSPEQWGEDTVDERTDLWAAGIVLFPTSCSSRHGRTRACARAPPPTTARRSAGASGASRASSASRCARAPAGGSSASSSSSTSSRSW
jgi:serine/threonine protein kinase